MPTCPRCRQAVDSQAIACPFCRTSLKAYGHPGIPLYRAEGETYLCDSCTYHEDDSCNYPQRPYAKECTLYHDRFQPAVSLPHRPSGWQALRRNEGLLALIGIAAVSLVIAVASR